MFEVKFGKVFASLTGADPKEEIKHIVDGEKNLAIARKKKLTKKKKIQKVRDGYVTKISKNNMG